MSLVPTAAEFETADPAQSWGACGPCARTSDNKHFECPPRMSDGRLFTDHRPRCDVNFAVAEQHELDAMDSYAYRQYLIDNAEDLMSEWRGSAYASARCGPCAEPFWQGTMAPERAVDECDAAMCKRVEVDPHGIGIGRNYGGEALEAAQAQAREAEQAAFKSTQINCCGAPADYDAYYPPQHLVPPSTLNRRAYPAGDAPLTGGDPSIVRR